MSTTSCSESSSPCLPAAPATGDRYRSVEFLGERISRVDVRCTPHKVLRGPPSDSKPAIRTLNPPEAALFRAICRRGGLSPHQYRDSIVARRQSACLRALRAGRVEDAVVVVTHSPSAAEIAMNAMLVGVTAFFRDPAVFRSIESWLTVHGRNRENLAAASIACSDGSELYSLAMLLAETGLLLRASLTGVDCRRQAVALASSGGEYSETAMETMPASFRSKYLHPSHAPTHRARATLAAGERWTVAKELRQACRWFVADALNMPGNFFTPASLDIVLCRNLAIYLTPQAANRLWHGLAALVRPGGLLVVGKAERPSSNVLSRFSRISPCVYQAQESQP